MHAPYSTRFHAAELQRVQARAHPFCLVCSRSNPMGLGVEFTLNEDGSVSSTFFGNPTLEGYQGLLHGGVIASLLDGAMTNCLFAHGRVAMTAELTVRYRRPVPIGVEIGVRAWIVSEAHGLMMLQAELEQDGCVAAAATAKFMMGHE